MMDNLLYEVLMKLAKRRNISVKEMDLTGTGDTNGAIFHYKGGYFIIIERNSPSREKLITLAHELGHYALHRDNDMYWDKLFRTDDNYYWTDNFNRKIEEEAERFAHRLLTFLESQIAYKVHERVAENQAFADLNYTKAVSGELNYLGGGGCGA
jgi:Zn-dependent peptidase ImmA (M78 family)